MGIGLYVLFRCAVDSHTTPLGWHDPLCMGVTRSQSRPRSPWPTRGRALSHVRIPDLADQGRARSAADVEVGVDVAASLADAGRHGPAAPCHGYFRRDAPVAAARGPQSRRGHPVPRHGARRRPPAADQAVRREYRPVGARRRPRLAGRAGALPGVRLRLPDLPRTHADRPRQSALEERDPAAFRAAPALSRHRRQAARVPARALDPGQVDGPPPAVRARVRTRRRHACPSRCRARVRAR